MISLGPIMSRQFPQSQSTPVNACWAMRLSQLRRHCCTSRAADTSLPSYSTSSENLGSGDTNIDCRHGGNPHGMRNGGDSCPTKICFEIRKEARAMPVAGHAIFCSFSSCLQRKFRHCKTVKVQSLETMLPLHAMRLEASAVLVWKRKTKQDLHSAAIHWHAPIISMVGGMIPVMWYVASRFCPQASLFSRCTAAQLYQTSVWRSN